jgi:aryl-alcohol dehydrogenase-like predicted oxidoreductase
VSDQRISRRDFIRQSAEVAGAAALTPTLLGAEPSRPVRTAADLVPLGKTGVKMPRLGIGTGSINGTVQRALGQAEFTKLVRHAYDRGVRYIDTADNYKTHEMVREAIKGLPRERLFILTKMPWGKPENVQNPLATLDRYRKELGVDYVDALLIHCTTKGTWPQDLRPMMDGFREAQAKGWVKLRGMSCHGLAALRQATVTDWAQVQLARINPQGHHVDGDHPTNPHDPQGKVAEAMKEIKAMHANGRGVIGMKMVGNGDFTAAEDREKALRYAMTCGFVDAVVVGVKSPAEVDEAIARINRALAA